MSDHSFGKDDEDIKAENQQSILLNAYAVRYEQTRPSHPVLLEAAQDVRLTTTYLITCAIACVRRACITGHDTQNLALLILQQRVTHEVLDAASSLLEHDEVVVRQLGAQILRESPGLHSVPSPYALLIISRIEKQLEIEQDIELLTWLLSAIGWQCHPAGTDILLRFIHDARVVVRRTVSDNLLNACKPDMVLPNSIANALLIFARDPDDDIRWSVFYDIAEFPIFFTTYRDVFRQTAANTAKHDSSKWVRTQAKKAYDVL